MELENIILSEATQTDSERQWSHVLIHRWFLNIKQKNKKENSLQTTISENLDNNEDTKS